MEPLQGDFCGARRSSVYRSRGLMRGLEVSGIGLVTSEASAPAKDALVRDHSDGQLFKRGTQGREKLRIRKWELFKGRHRGLRQASVRRLRKDRGIRASTGRGVSPQRHNQQRSNAAHNVQVLTVGQLRRLHDERPLHATSASNPVPSCLAASHSLGQGYSLDVARARSIGTLFFFFLT
jgi:hypothetical protein